MDICLSDLVVLKKAAKLSEFKLCDNCLGRQFAKIEHGMSNKERGQKISEFLNYSTTRYKDCWLCTGLIGEIKKFSNLVIHALEKFEFDTFLVGSIIADDILEKEKRVIDDSSFHEPLKQEMNREIGKIVEKETGKNADFFSPTITVLVDTTFDDLCLEIRSLYIYGRYWKLLRGIPQTKWYCKKCRGVGCPDCDYQGKLYQTSVEELIAPLLVTAFRGSTVSFHGAGREDIDAKMLGNGRPFIIEIKNPEKRSLDLHSLEKQINLDQGDRVKVKGLKVTDKEHIKKLKSTSWDKTYRVTIKGDFEERKLKEAVNILGGKKICQHTPTRVVHRRSDVLRERRIRDIKIEEIMNKRAIITIRAEAGTYIKEFINGDGGRTTPSLGEVLNQTIATEKLDVIKIHDSGE